MFKTNLARSVLQAEAVERKEGALKVRLRQKKHNFGVLTKPFKAELKFTEEQVTLKAGELDAADLAEEQTLGAVERIKLSLRDGPKYPEELAEDTEIVLKTVRNTLSRLRNAGEVKPTGEKDGRSEQVKLSVPNPNPLYRDGTREDNKSGNDDRSEGEGSGAEHPLDCKCPECSAPEPKHASSWERKL